MDLIEELIKENLDINYISPNKIICNNIFFSENHPDLGDLLINKDDINELYIIEFRQWRQ